jgi:hypothetical protein
MKLGQNYGAPSIFIFLLEKIQVSLKDALIINMIHWEIYWRNMNIPVTN